MYDRDGVITYLIKNLSKAEVAKQKAIKKAPINGAFYF